MEDGDRFDQAMVTDMRILVVDDSDDGREIAAAMLLAAGYENVATAGSAADAFAVLTIGGPTTEPPAAVGLLLLDIVMPGMNGIEACARIRTDPRYSDVPIIMVTSLADMESLSNAFVAGATDYVTKPLNRVELLARIRSALKFKAASPPTAMPSSQAPLGSPPT
jgi:sigma-B regulation protein RsbU (phosphoserine phosphatase)